MTRPSLRSVFQLLTYGFAALGVAFFVLVLVNANFYNCHEQPRESPMAILGAFGVKSGKGPLPALREAAEKGDKCARYRLACELYRKTGTPEERSEGLTILTELAAADFSDYSAGDAAASLGQIYAEGLGVPRDAGKAAQYRILADKAGVVSVRAPLALAYLKGDGVAKDEEAAYRLLERLDGEYLSGGIFWDAAASR